MLARCSSVPAENLNDLRLLPHASFITEASQLALTYGIPPTGEEAEQKGLDPKLALYPNLCPTQAGRCMLK